VPQCLYNIFSEFISRKSLSDSTNSSDNTSFILSSLRKVGIKPDDLTQHNKTKKSIEILVVGMLIGVACVPGGHRQFTLWYCPLIPIAIMMTGMPMVSVFWVY